MKFYGSHYNRIQNSGADVVASWCRRRASDYGWQSAFRIVEAIMYSVDGRIKDTLLLGAYCSRARSAVQPSASEYSWVFASSARCDPIRSAFFMPRARARPISGEKFWRTLRRASFRVAGRGIGRFELSADMLSWDLVLYLPGKREDL